MITVLIADTRGDEAVDFKVKYLSSDRVYIDGGSADGLVAGDTLFVGKGESKTAALQVLYVAAHSSSCRIIDQSLLINPGDVVSTLLKTENIEESPTDVGPASETIEAPTPGSGPADQERRSSRLKGRVNMGYYAWNDLGDKNLDFSQPALGFRLTVRNLWGSDYYLRVRTRTRYNQRSRAYSSSVLRNEWRNRVHELSLGSENQFGFSLELGRIIPKDMSGIGYIDGLMVKKNLTDVFSMGIFGGAQPEWQYGNLQTRLQKYGLFLSGGLTREGGLRLESTIALAAEYHYRTVSREFLHLRNLFSGSGFSFYQSADLDINRSWRSEKSGENLTLTNFYVSARRRLGGKINAGVSYDTRKRYWSYDTQSVADSLFDDLARRGLKASLNLKAPGSINIGTNYGMRAREGAAEISNSYSVNISKSNFTALGIGLGFQVTGFGNEFSEGLKLSYQTSKYFRRGHRLSLGYGVYRYTYKSDETSRSSRWFEGGLSIRLTKTLMFSGDFRRSIGDDLNGLTFLADLAYNLR